MYVYINGRYVKKDEAMISPFDHGFLYGIGLFETFRTYEGHPFLLDDHLERLNEGLQEFQIEKRFKREEVMTILSELIRLNKWTNSYIRFNVSAGLGEIGLQTEPYNEPTIIMFQKPLPAKKEIQEKEAVFVKIPRNTPEIDYRLKSHHFFNNVAAKREIGAEAHQEGIFLTKEGFLAEGITSNLFWVKDGEMYTPALETGILNGITRKLIIQLAKEFKLKVHEGFYIREQLLESEEIFFTNSVQEIVPVSKLEVKSFPGKNGEFYQRFYERYQGLVYNTWSIDSIEETV